MDFHGKKSPSAFISYWKERPHSREYVLRGPHTSTPKKGQIDYLIFTMGKMLSDSGSFPRGLNSWLINFILLNLRSVW